MTAAADRHLLFGLLALQNGLIDQGQLMLAFQAWTRDKAKSLADHLEARGDLRAPKRAGLEALAAVHVEDARWRRGEEPRRRPRQPIHPRRPGRAGRPGYRGHARTGRRNKNGHATEADDDHDPDRTASLAVGGSTSDGQRFRLLRPHARGGLGEVFVALDSELHREVALKQILDKHADDPISRQRFLLEAEVTGGLEHPGIVPVYGLGTYGDGRPYYAMRFIKGDSLKEAIEQFHGGYRGSLKRTTPAKTVRQRPRARAAQAAPPLHRRLQRHRLRPLPRRAPPRHQAGQHHRRQARRDAGGRLGAGQAVGRAEPSVGERTLAPSSSGHRRRCPAVPWARRPT